MNWFIEDFVDRPAIGIEVDTEERCILLPLIYFLVYAFEKKNLNIFLL